MRFFGLPKRKKRKTWKKSKKGRCEACGILFGKEWKPNKVMYSHKVRLLDQWCFENHKKYKIPLKRWFINEKD